MKALTHTELTADLAAFPEITFPSSDAGFQTICLQLVVMQPERCYPSEETAGRHPRTIHIFFISVLPESTRI